MRPERLSPRSHAPRGNAVLAALRPSPDRTTRSVAAGIPTRSVGTRGNPLPSLAAFLVVLGFATAARGAPEPIPVATPAGRKEPVSFAKEVADILAARCVGCHSAALAENKLNLEEVAGMLKGGKRGPAVVPGKAEES